MKLFLACILCLTFRCRGALTETEEEMVDDFMEELMECRGMPGTAITLVRNGTVELTRGYGFANVENQEPFSADTLFSIASVTKQFTATLAGKLMADSVRLSWDSVARDILGEDFHFIDGYRSNNTMLRDLISHQTGIPRHDPTWCMNALDTRQQIVMEKMRYMAEMFPIRSDFLYNNNMYSVLGLVLEREFGLSWEDMVRAELFEPLGMNSSTFYDFAAPEFEGFCTPYTYNLSADDPTVLNPTPFETWMGAGLAGPAASVCATANDMARWILFVLSRGLTPEGDRIMSESDMDRLWYAESATPDLVPGKPYEPVTDTGTNYGLGYRSGHYRGYRTYSHGGDLTGFHSEIFLLPDMQIGTFFNTNFGGISGERVYIHRYLVDVLLGVEPAYNATEVCDIFENTARVQYDSDMALKLGTFLSEEEVWVLTDLGLLEYFFYMVYNHDTVYPVDKTMIETIQEAKLKLRGQNNMATRAIESYEGEYGEFTHGNLTITSSNVCIDCLYMEYGTIGQYTLQPTNGTDTFIGFNVYPVFDLILATFAGEDDVGNAMSVTIPMYNLFTPPVFERGLLMSEAPLPRNDLCVPVY